MNDIGMMENSGFPGTSWPRERRGIIQEYWIIGKQRLPWSNLVATATWNNSGIMGIEFRTPAFQHSTIPLFQ